eukprot:1398495-Amphidinium_carterae.1
MLPQKDRKDLNSSQQHIMQPIVYPHDLVYTTPGPTCQPFSIKLCVSDYAKKTLLSMGINKESSRPVGRRTSI